MAEINDDTVRVALRAFGFESNDPNYARRMRDALEAASVRLRVADCKSRPAAAAFSDLHLFAAIEAICENSIFSAASNSDVGRIIKICKAAQQKRLRAYDLALRETKP